VPTPIKFLVAKRQYLSFRWIDSSSIRGLAINLRKFIFLAANAKEEVIIKYANGLVMRPRFNLVISFKSSLEKINSSG